MQQRFDTKEVWLQYGHWVSIGTSAALVLSILFLAGSNGAAGKSLRDANKYGQEFKKALNTVKADALPEPVFPWQLEKAWQHLTMAQKGPGPEAFYEQPRFGPSIISSLPNQLWLYEPRNLSLHAGMDKISLRWDVPSLPPESGKGQEMAEIAGYFLFKQWEVKGKKSAKIIELTENFYEDSAVEGKTDYSYEVRAYTENIDVKGCESLAWPSQELSLSQQATEKSQGNSTAWMKELGFSKATASVQGRLQPNYKIDFLGTYGRNTASIRLSKWEKGAWRSGTCHIETGQRIILTYAPLLGKVYWDSGWLLKSIGTENITIRGTSYFKHPQTVPAHDSVERDEVYWSKETAVGVITIVDENGAEQKIYRKHGTR